MSIDSGSDSDWLSACSTPEFQDHQLTSTAEWQNDTAFGLVHHTGCRTCLQYMSHIVAASENDDESFKAAVRERDTRITTRYLDGIREGRRLQREHDHRRIIGYRADRDEAIMLNAVHQREISSLYEELESLKNNFLALQVAYEEAVSGGSQPLEEKESAETASQVIEMQHMMFDTMDGSGIPDTRRPIPGSAHVGDTPAPVKVYMDNAEPVMNSSRMSPPQLFPSIPFATTSSRPTQIILVDEDDSFVSTDSDSSSHSFSDISYASSSLSKPAVQVQQFSPGVQDPNTVPDLKLLMDAANGRNLDALCVVRRLYFRAQQSPRIQRTEMQKYLLANWKGDPISAQNASATTSGPSKPKQRSSPTIFVDACPTGIGFVMNEQWLAWKLLGGSGEDGRDNNWGELVAVELGLRTVIAAGYFSTTLQVYSDNTGVIDALKKGTTKHVQQRKILQSILELKRVYNIEISPSYIPSKENPADGPSRGVYAPASLRFPEFPPLPSHLLSFVQPVL